ncbi:MAG: tRNA (adenosine(37)-N6)-threonylcarbamoyltransferase complex ATPase subunit type 1 TsaE [Methylomicrobium sp.]
MQYKLIDSDATEAIGAALARQLPDKCRVFLKGPLGAGKTTLVRGFLRAIGHRGAVKSPTYTLVEEYRLAGRSIFHFDLYRLTDPEELEWIGFDDYLQQDAICLIEWPEMGKGFLPEPHLVLTLQVVGHQRTLDIDIIDAALKKTLTLA